ncbi:hypothetical protein KO488_08295 [Poseidonibacter lekithochrous]|uniref:hypothetical protein n=1 Tax=Poseidonibacter TaxID=2321187 RepID=UPI001C096A88|nr:MULTISPECIES: hypothetical protein [Poseidonibacter]MBU3014754.1 hypothetical protein [Poseidonibacter lekithochrous]MDO6828052.1 hypothetical protein [Poseidonibacter sp. 1_MG-2023]
MHNEMKQRIEKLNTNLMLKETKIIICIDEIKTLFIKADFNSKKSFFNSLDELRHLKHDYDCIKTQLETLTIYEFRH